MRIPALIVAVSAALALTACQKAEDKAPEAGSEAVEAAGISDPAAVAVTIDQAAADARAAAEGPVAAEVPAPAGESSTPAAPAAAAEAAH